MEKLNRCDHALFVPKAKLNFHVFNDLVLRDINATLLHLISSSVLQGAFSRVNFYNASFLSTKFLKVSFDGCNLASSDICSIWAKDCIFTDTDFNSATISDCTFIQCNFSRCSFESVSLTNSHFIDCTFEQLPIDDSTVTLNTFTRCAINNSSFTESFYYQIFEECTFEDAEMPTSLLGYNFGFAKKTLKQLAIDSQLETVENDLLKKGLFINAAILRINQVNSYYDIALIACVKAIGQMIQEDILVKTDEIQFIRKLTMHLHEHNQIAPISLFHIWQELFHLMQNKVNNISSEKALPHIREFANMLYFEIQKFQEALQASLECLPNGKQGNGLVEVKIIYSFAPELHLLQCLEQIHSKYCKTKIKPRLIRTEVGSYIEYLEIVEAAIPYLQTVFALLGVVAPFVVYHKQKRDHEREREEAKKEAEAEKEKLLEQQRSNSLSAVQSSPSILLPHATIILPDTDIIVANSYKLIAQNKFVESQNYRGYNSHNVHSVTITCFHETHL